MAFKNRLTNIQPVGANSTATITVGTGPKAPTLDKLQLTVSGSLTETLVTGIRGFINGREFYREGSGVLHNKRRDYLGIVTPANEIVLDFTEPNARSAIEQNLSALPLSQMQDLRFEVDMGAGATHGLTALAHFRAPTSNPFIKKQRRLNQQFSAGGEQTVYLPSGANGGKLVRIWAHESAAGNITAFELRARNSVAIEATRVETENDQQANGLVPQAGIFVIDFIADGNLAGWFDTAALGDVELRFTGTAGATYEVYLEYLDPIGRL